MNKPLVLSLTLKGFDALHKALDTTRGTFVQGVRREYIEALLIDHSRLLKLIDHRNPEEVTHEGKETKTQAPGAAGAE